MCITCITFTGLSGFARKSVFFFFSFFFFFFCIKKGQRVWLLASRILTTYVLGTSNNGQGGLVTRFSIIAKLYTGNQQLMK